MTLYPGYVFPIPADARVRESRNKHGGSHVYDAVEAGLVMFCTRCGIKLKDEDHFCAQCGTGVRGRTASASMEGVPGYRNKLSRFIEEKKIAGVCAGFARYLNMDVTLVRIVWLALVFVPPGVGAIAYIIAWIAMPRDPLMIEAPAKPVQQGV